MQRQLTEAQIAEARRRRTAGETYPSIAAAIGADVSVSSIRAHCSDIGGDTIRRRTDKARINPDGKGFRPFSELEDGAIIAWVLSPTIEGGETMNGLAKRMNRARHSVAARIKTLKRHGRLPA